MNIGIDISQIVYEGTGVSRFTRGLVESILEYDKKNKWTFFFSSLRKNLDKDLERRIHKTGHVLIKRRLPPTLLAFLNNNIHNFILSSIIYNLSSHLDWFISSDWTEPPFSGIKKATIVHDLAYLRFPETVEANIHRTQTSRLRHVQSESNIIFSDSKATKNDLVSLLHIDPRKIVVNCPGVEVKKPELRQINQTLNKYDLRNKNFILTVGKLEPRKNLDRLIQTIEQQKSPLQLIVVGSKGWLFNDEIMKQSEKLRFLGLIPDEELYSLYSSCLFFVFPSIWEGFGYPIVEAMRLGAPVACSNNSPIKEIAQDSALLFDPLDIGKMTQCINELSQNETLRKELIKKGLERSKIFSWEKYYTMLVATLEQYKK